jgi:hypothetical protein
MKTARAHTLLTSFHAALAGPSGARALGLVLALAAIPASIPLLACDTGQFAASSTVGVMRRAAPSASRYRDPDLAEAAIPASMGQMEGLLELIPGDMVLRSLMGRSYVSFGYAFMEEHMEVAEQSGTEEEIEHWRNRATLAYIRAREVTIGGLDQRYPQDGGLVATQHTGLEAFQAHLNLYTNVETDVPLLMFATYAWARYIGLHRDDMNAIADLPYVTAMADRVLALDPEYLDHAPLALHAGLIGSAPQALGGRPQDARIELERVIELSHRQNLLYLMTEAQIVAIALQDRALYRSLLEEIIAFDVDSVPDQRLANTVAQRRARRWLGRIDELFEPEGTDMSSGDPESAGGEDPAPAPVE